MFENFLAGLRTVALIAGALCPLYSDAGLMTPFICGVCLGMLSREVRRA